MKKEQIFFIKDLKNLTFDLTEQDVLRAREVAQKSVVGFKEQLKGPEEDLKKSASRLLPGAEEKLKVLSQPEDKVLARCKEFFNRAVELGDAKLDEDQMEITLAKEFPDIQNYYFLLREREWGYYLGGAAIRGRNVKEFNLS